MNATVTKAHSTAAPAEGVRNSHEKPDRAAIDGELHLVVKALDGIVALADFLEERLSDHDDGRTASAGIAVLAGDASGRLRAALDALSASHSGRETANA